MPDNERTTWGYDGVNCQWWVGGSDSPADVRTNPDTCWHRVIHTGQRDGHPGFYCGSCTTLITDWERELRTYEFDSDHNVWVTTGKPPKFVTDARSRNAAAQRRMESAFAAADEAMRAYLGLPLLRQQDCEHRKVRFANGPGIKFECTACGLKADELARAIANVEYIYNQTTRSWHRDGPE